MNKLIIVIAVVAVVAGIIVAFRNFSASPEGPASPSITPQSSIAPPPFTEATPSPTPTPRMAPSPVQTSVPSPRQSPTAPQGILDRIEAAIRAKLRR